jgi:hypothetical protein
MDRVLRPPSLLEILSEALKGLVETLMPNFLRVHR